MTTVHRPRRRSIDRPRDSSIAADEPATTASTTVRVWPSILLACLVAVAPFDLNMPVDGWTDLFIRPLMLIAATVGIVVIIAGRQRLDRTLSAAVVALIGTYGLTAALSDGPTTGFAITARVAVLGLVFLAGTVGIAGPPNVSHLRIGALIGAVVAGLIGFTVFLAGGDLWGSAHFVGGISESRGVARLTRPFSHANVATMYLAPAGVLAAGAAAIARRGRTAIVWTSGALVATVAVALTMSRAGLIAMTVGAALVALTAASGSGKPRRIGATVALPTAMVAILALPTLVWDRWDRRLASVESAAPAPLGRPEIWRQAIDAFATDPIVGLGPGRFGHYSSGATPDGFAAAAHAHSPILETLATGGLLVAISSVLFVGVAYRAGSDRKRGAARPLWPAAATATVPMLVDNPFPFSSSAILVAVLAGAVVGLRRGRADR